MPRRVTFSNTTEYVFNVGYNGSTVPHDAIPGVGLTGKPIAIRCKKITTQQSQPEGVCMYLPIERLYYLKRNGLSKEEVVNLKTCQTILHQQLKVSRHEALQARLNQNQMHHTPCKRKCHFHNELNSKSQRILTTEA